MKKIIVWFRKDLRVHDNPALWEAVLQGTVLPLYIWSEEEEFEYKDSAASKCWLHHSLHSLKQRLAEHGLNLTVRSGRSFEVLTEFISETEADAVFFNSRYEPSIAYRDNEIAKRLTQQGFDIRSYNSHLLFPSEFILNQKAEPYKVFTSFWKRVQQEVVNPPLPIPLDMVGSDTKYRSLHIDELKLVPSGNWTTKLNGHMMPGEQNGINQWLAFSTFEPERYVKDRDIPFALGTSLLSPYFASGDLSVKAVWHAAKTLSEASDEPLVHESLLAFMRQLVWREFAYHQLIHFPKIDQLPLRNRFMSFPWRTSTEDFNRWKKGLTGYPLVDAGMRELWETGTIHNRVRMVVASFLVKHLLISWKDGHDWFKETLVDLDIAVNAMGWQWVTGSGIDSAPYFRIFNPIIQSEKFDSKGDYIRKWIPELQALPNKHIHRPWEAPIEILEQADIQLGSTYPLPMVEHSFARNRALEAYATIKNI